MWESIKKAKAFGECRKVILPHCSVPHHLLPTTLSSCFLQTKSDELAVHTLPTFTDYGVSVLMKMLI